MVPGGFPFKVTLVWTDYPGATGAFKAIVNDLDLTLNAPDGTVFLGNSLVNGESYAGGSYDRLNVEEQVLVKNPVPGLYTVDIAGYNIPYGPQPFALVITGASDVSSAGRIMFDRQRYNSGSTLKILVADSDLNSDPGYAEQMTLDITSGSEPDSEVVTLIETSTDSAMFAGTLPLAATPANSGDGKLQTGNGDTITAIYRDANDGSGKAATVAAVAIVDNIAPVISNLNVAAITDTAATISWSTDEAANTVLFYGVAGGDSAMIIDKRLTAQHTMSLSSLREGAIYHVTAESTDEAGNSGSSGATSFTTYMFPPALSVTSSEGDLTYQSATVISGVSTDPSGIAFVTVNGSPASYRSSDGFYSINVPLQLGNNIITVQATDLLDNTAVSALTVMRLQRSDLYMLAVAGPKTASQQSIITITDKVCNNGPGSATGFAVGFYLSTDQLLSADDIFIGAREVASIASGDCAVGMKNVTVPAMVPGGSLYLLAFADYTGKLVETDKGNNVLAGEQITLPNPLLAPPASLTVPATNDSGSFQVYFGASNVGGVTYVLEQSRNGGAYSVVYSGTNTWANVDAIANGVYSFRVKATKTGYADSGYTSAGSCVVTLACATPASLTVPATNASGSFPVYFGASNVGGVTYVLEQSRNGGAYSVVSSGTNTWTNVGVIANGVYSFRVKATKTGYADSGYTSAGSCVVTLASSPNFQAALIITHPEIEAKFYSLSDAYGYAVANGKNNFEIAACENTFFENLILSRPISFTLAGGKDSGYYTNVGFTKIAGYLEVQYGSIEIDSLIIQ